jgi:hypothetical protein
MAEVASHRGVRDQAGTAWSMTEVNASRASPFESLAARNVYFADAEKTEEARREAGREWFLRGDEGLSVLGKV